MNNENSADQRPLSLLAKTVHWAAIFGAIGFGLWLSLEVLLLVFGGILLAIFLCALSGWVTKHTRLPSGWSLALIIVFLLALFIAAIWFAAPDVAKQLDELTKSLPRAVQKLRQQVMEYGWINELLDRVPSSSEIGSQNIRVLQKASSALSTTAGALASMIIVLFIGLYLSINPELYISGFLRLVPIHRRPRAREVLDSIGHTLRLWILSKVIAMAVIGVATWAGLSFLNVPLALILGILAALLTFIPNIGPILSAIPAILLAFMDNEMAALYVTLLYFSVQMIESYILTPLLQQKTASLPAALTMATQVLFGLLFGGIGVILATPITAAAMVAIKMIYVEDVLGDREKALRCHT